MGQHTVIDVGLEERSYPIRIGDGLLAEVGRHLKNRPVGNRYAIISDDTVSTLYAKQLQNSLAKEGIKYSIFSFPAGEASKNMQTVAMLCGNLAAAGFDRKDAVIALGGGVPGDIAGFVASIYMRGIPFVQVPTTLLSQVDSSVGGKTGVDIPEGKNLVGAFYQPKSVFIDLAVLRTLPEQEFLGGMAEVIKYGVIWDREFFDFLKKNRQAILTRNEETLRQMIARCCEIKAAVVEKDEREGDLRRILNYGHTIGHAIEGASDFTIIHGLAVAMGMAAAADLAVKQDLLSSSDADAIKQLLLDYGMDVNIPRNLDRPRMLNYLQTDKKVVGGKVFFVLPTSIGQVVITEKVDKHNIDEVLATD